MPVVMISATPTDSRQSSEQGVEQVPGWLLGSLDDVTLPLGLGESDRCVSPDRGWVSPDVDLLLRDA